MKTKLIALSAVLASLCAFTARMSAKVPAGPSLAVGSPVAWSPIPESKADMLPAPIMPPAPPVVLYVGVDPMVQLDLRTLALHLFMADTLSGSAFVPDDRRHYYSAYVNSKTETIRGWSASVKSVEPNGLGHLVTIVVTPSMSSSRAGAAAIPIGPNYLEQYQVTKGRATYVGALDPDGTAGKDFPMIGL